MLIRFPETDVRSMGRTAAGVKAITLCPGDEVVGMESLNGNEEILIVTKTDTGNGHQLQNIVFKAVEEKGLKRVTLLKKW